MKLQNIYNIDMFFDTVKKCKGNVYLISPEGDCLNLKSKLCRYIAFAELFVNDNEVIKELELKTEEPEDTEKFIDFMMREG